MFLTVNDSANFWKMGNIKFELMMVILLYMYSVVPFFKTLLSSGPNFCCIILFLRPPLQDFVIFLSNILFPPAYVLSQICQYSVPC